MGSPGGATPPTGFREGVRLGVDVGDARVGLAACDPAGVLATPVATLRRDSGTHRDQEQIVTAAREREAIEVIVGLPRNLSGQEGVAAQRVRDYAASLHRRLGGIPVRLVDERLSTVDAHRQLHASGVPGRAHRARVDQAAAVVILQAALDTERSTGHPAGVSVGGRKPRTKRSGTQREGSRP